MQHDREKLRRALACVSDMVLAEFDGLEVIGRSSIACKLDAGTGADAVKQRGEIIKAIRGGEHAELIAGARTFKQKQGSPNTRFLRHLDEWLPELAASYKNQPFLLDHRSGDQEARMGTIAESKLHDHGGTGWKSLDQQLHIVKPHAVISFLDGTIDRFSIGWARGDGDVICTAHRSSILARGACGCWPGDMAVVDGKELRAEWEFQKARGTECSGVNSPAVFAGTGVKDIKAALCEELGLSDRVIEFEPEKQPKENQMLFTRLAALLGLTSLSSANDEESALAAVSNMKRERAAAEQELATTKAELATAKTKLAATEKERDDANEASLTSQVDAELNGAYREGKLRYGRDDKGAATPSTKETRLRRIAKEDGLEGLRAELADMDVVVPVGERVLTDKTPEPKRLRASGSGAAPADRRAPALAAGNDDILNEVAHQLGLDDMPRFSEEV